MTSDRYQFDDFVLDPADRTLRRDGIAVEVSARYLDALILLVAEAMSLLARDGAARKMAA